MDESLTLYQILHISFGKVHDLPRHVAVLDRACRDLFGVGWQPDTPRLEQEVLDKVNRLYYNKMQAVFMRLELDEQGAYRLQPAGVSLYTGFALRSLRPAGVSVAGLTPLNGYPLPAREASALAARRLAEFYGGEVAVQVGADGYYHTIEGSPMAAVTGHTVWVTPEDILPNDPKTGVRMRWNAEEEPSLSEEVQALMPPMSVEGYRIIEAAKRAGLEVVVRPFGPSDVGRFDEIFWSDHRGVTALSSCDGRLLMSLIAERIARTMNLLG